MMRLGMTNPPYILEHLDEMAKILSHPRVYSFLHIPVQSGSDAILGEMRREYCVKDFERMVDFLRAHLLQQQAFEHVDQSVRSEALENIIQFRFL